MPPLAAHFGLIAALGAGAADEKPLLELAQHAKATFERLDTDGDGAISRREAKADPELTAQFPLLDINENGELEEAEFAHFAPANENQ